MLVFNRQKHDEPRLDELSKLISDLETFLEEEVDFRDIGWKKNFNAILDFQDDGGSFKLFDSYDIPTDARVDFCWIPTYLCTAVLMKACLTDHDSFTQKEKSALLEGLRISCARNLRGHGYDAFKGQIEALNIFIKAGLREFIDLYPEICPEFTEMIEDIISQFHQRESEGKFTGSWGESYEDEIRSINEYFSQRQVFVYGTLLSGEDNHHFLDESTCLGKAFAKGYDMYNVGWYPAIVPGDGLAIGELYQVPLADIPAIDRLEGEGRLYIKKCERVNLNGKSTFAFIYVYLRDVSGLERIPAWKDDYVWYVSYGSNMSKERFMKYIKGGYVGNRHYPSCEDTSDPVAVKVIEIGYDMYFGEYSPHWSGGVSFLDVTKKGNALGVAYLITKNQFRHIVAQENGGKCPKKGKGWYGDVIDLGSDGFEIKTVTKKILHDYSEPSQRYLNTLAEGIMQNWPNMTEKEIGDYLDGCMR
jgi:gamma-glutamylcyclotransferase (GGCT)/AIG2-like uncharacterized protein YtfP